MAAATQHTEGPKNKLASSSSPYLKQHETNPVSIYALDWLASAILLVLTLAEMHAPGSL